MSGYVQRATIIDALNAAGVEFDVDATVVELRPLYDELIQRQRAAALLDDLNGPMIGGLAERRASVGSTLSHQSNASGHSAEERRQVAREATERRAQLNGVEPPRVNHGVQALPAPTDTDELGRVEQQLRLARMRRELQVMDDEYSETRARRLDFAAFEAMVHQFSGDNPL